MSDLEVLGLTEDYTYSDLKKAFRIKSKKLHPDINDNSLESHIAMIKLNQAYSNLLQLLEKPKEIEQKQKEDPYSIYRRGISVFQRIHPSKWKVTRKKGLFNPGAIETKSETPKIIKSMINDMAKAYHDFSIVVNQYPNSDWASDARTKMNVIEKMTVRYMKILCSYGG